MAILSVTILLMSDYFGKCDYFECDYYEWGQYFDDIENMGFLKIENFQVPKNANQTQFR